MHVPTFTVPTAVIGYDPNSISAAGQDTAEKRKKNRRRKETERKKKEKVEDHVEKSREKGGLFLTGT